MPDPSWMYTEATEDIFSFDDDWQEIGAGTKPGGAASFTQGGGMASMVGTFPYNKTRDFIKKTLGYSWADTGSPWALHRINPIRHPMYPWMRAESVSIEAINPLGSEVPGTTPKEFTEWVPSLVPSENLKRMGRYSRAIATIRFKYFPFPHVDDAVMVANGLPEYYRNTSIFENTDPALELLMSSSERFIRFLETDGVAPSPTVNESFGGTVAEYLSKINFVMIWHDVPINYIVNQVFIPKKLKSVIGKVNSNDGWLSSPLSTTNGFRKNTLLFDAPKLTREVHNIATTDGRIPFRYTVVLPFKYFEPTPAVESPIFRGWNLFPYARSGKWFSGGRGDTGSVPYIAEENFDKIFEHVSKP